MWNPFKKKPQPTPPQANRVESITHALQAEGRVSELEQELERLDKAVLSPVELETWHHLYGIAALRAGRGAEATARFEDAHRQFPSSARIRFSLGQQYVNMGSLDRGFELFRSCHFPEIPREYLFAQARYAYFWNRFDDGCDMLRPLFKVYQDLKILDDHFLYVRGLPFFGTWWSYFAALSILRNDTNEIEEITEYVCAHCHDFDFDRLRNELRAYREDTPHLLLPYAERHLESATPGVADGYHRIQRAVIQTRWVRNYAAAESLLDEVQLTEHDYPWLSDIRTLAKAESAHRFSMLEEEARWADAFRATQPRLLEPDIAITFHLLRYQEQLKKRAQGR